MKLRCLTIAGRLKEAIELLRQTADGGATVWLPKKSVCVFCTVAGQCKRTSVTMHAVQDAFGGGEERHDCAAYDQEEYLISESICWQ